MQRELFGVEKAGIQFETQRNTADIRVEIIENETVFQCDFGLLKLHCGKFSHYIETNLALSVTLSNQFQ